MSVPLTNSNEYALKTINKTAKRQGNNVETSMFIKDDYVDKKIENMKIDDLVKFSTITLNFYQDNTVKILIVNNDNLYDYQPSFFQRLSINIVDRWVYFKEFILAISHLWMLPVIGFIAYFWTRYYANRKKVKGLSLNPLFIILYKSLPTRIRF